MRTKIKNEQYFKVKYKFNQINKRECKLDKDDSFCWDNYSPNNRGKSSSLNTKQHAHYMCQLFMTVCPIVLIAFCFVMYFPF